MKIKFEIKIKTNIDIETSIKIKIEINIAINLPRIEPSDLLSCSEKLDKSLQIFTTHFGEL